MEFWPDDEQGGEEEDDGVQWWVEFGGWLWDKIAGPGAEEAYAARVRVLRRAVRRTERELTQCHGAMDGHKAHLLRSARAGEQSSGRVRHVARLYAREQAQYDRIALQHRNYCEIVRQAEDMRKRRGLDEAAGWLTAQACEHVRVWNPVAYGAMMGRYEATQSALEVNDETLEEALSRCAGDAEQGKGYGEGEGQGEEDSVVTRVFQQLGVLIETAPLVPGEDPGALADAGDLHRRMEELRRNDGPEPPQHP